MRVTLDGVIACLRDLERSRTVSEFADRAIDSLWELIPSIDLAFNVLDEAQQRVELYRCRDESGWEETDEEFWSHADELPICWGLAPGAPGVIRTQDVISGRAMRNSRIYSEVMHPSGAEHEMKIALSSPPWVTRAFMFARDRPYTDRELELARLIAPHLEAVHRRLRRCDALTQREREVLELVAQGLTNREVAAALHIASGTVRAHLEHAFGKLGVRTRTAAVAAIS
jgi:DNA-binding CsgD family transcriptional regulator